MARQLVKLLVKNIAAVGKPANKRSFLVVKSMDGVEAAGQPSAQTPQLMTFGDALFQQRMRAVHEELGTQYSALMRALDSACCADVVDRRAAVEAALSAFTESLDAAVPTMVDGLMDGPPAPPTDDGAGETPPDYVEKSAARTAAVTHLRDALTASLLQGDTTMAEVTKPDAGALAKFGQSMAALFGRTMGADEATVVALEKAAAGEPVVEIPVEVTTRLSKAEADNAALTERLSKAEAETTRLKNEADLRKFAEEIAGYKGIGLEPEKDAELLKSISEKLTPEQSTRVRELFKSAAAQAAVSGMFKEIGSKGDGPMAGSAAAEVEQRVADLVAKSAGTDRDAAVAEVFKADPALYAKYRAENSVKI